LWLRADGAADWYRNLRAHPRCLVRFAGREVEGKYEPVTGMDGLIAARDEPIADDGQGLRHLIGLWRKKYGNEWVGDWYVERGRIPLRVRIVNTA
jgi:hypothetical protein